MTVKKALALLITAVLSSTAVFAISPAIRSIDIDVVLKNDGSALVTEKWDICATQGTEWYLVKDNMAGMEISDLNVEEAGKEFVNIGRWNIDASMAQKAGKCGVISKRNGYELCWGIGEYGDHQYTISYFVSNMVIGMSDYDKLHFQFVSPGLSSRPKDVKLSISAEDFAIGGDNSRLWGFGFIGEDGFEDGKAIYRSTERFQEESSVIALMRFDKGLFNPQLTKDESFDNSLNKALEGSDFSGKDNSPLAAFLGLLSALWPLLAIMAVGIFSSVKKGVDKKKFFGVKKMSDITWSRDIPFNGNLLESEYVLSVAGLSKKKNQIAGAMILRMIDQGQLTVNTDEKGKVEISFNEDADLSKMSESGRKLFQMMKEASGSDMILQDKEFSRWSSKHVDTVNAWANHLLLEAQENLSEQKLSISHKSLTEKGQEEARKVIGFKKFLEDFTLVDERKSVEVTLWKDYLVFAALYGIADKVAKELRDINPEAYQQSMPYDYYTTRNVIYMTDNLSRSITNAVAAKKAAEARAVAKAMEGFGGRSSFGGGGGFSGGGFGGGSR